MSDLYKLQEALSDFAEVAAQGDELTGGYVGPVTAAALVREGVAEFVDAGTHIRLNIGTRLNILY